MVTVQLASHQITCCFCISSLQILSNVRGLPTLSNVKPQYFKLINREGMNCNVCFFFCLFCCFFFFNFKKVLTIRIYICIYNNINQYVHIFFWSRLLHWFGSNIVTLKLGEISNKLLLGSETVGELHSSLAAGSSEGPFFPPRARSARRRPAVACRWWDHNWVCALLPMRETNESGSAAPKMLPHRKSLGG